MLRVSSHQSVFIPWIGFWNKLIIADLFVFAGGTDFSIRDYEHRVKLHGAWLTLPIDKTTSRGKIKEVRLLDMSDVCDRLRKELCVKRYKYHHRIEPVIETISTYSGKYLHDMNVALLKQVAKILGVSTRLCIDDNIPLEKTKSLRLSARLSRHAKEFEYLSGPGGKNYLTDEFPFSISYQTVKEGVCTDTILQLIANHESPIDHIMQAVTYERLELGHV